MKILKQYIFVEAKQKTMHMTATKEMRNGKRLFILHESTIFANEYGIKYIIQQNIRHDVIHLIYAHSRLTRKDAVAIWKVKYKSLDASHLL